MNEQKWTPLIIGYIVLALIPLLVTQQYVLSVMCSMMLAMYLSSAWNIIGGYAGQFALGNGVYFGIGAYVAALGFMYENLSPWAAMLLAIALSIIFAVIVGLPSFRLSGTYFALCTVAFLQVMRLIFLGTDHIFGYETRAGTGLVMAWKGGFKWLQFSEKKYYFWIILTFLFIVLIVSNLIRNTKMGTYLAAIKTNQGAASTIGINVLKYKMFAQFICAAFFACGGVYYVMYVSFVEPASAFSYPLSLEIMMYAVIGGVGTLWGPLVGASSLVLLYEILRVRLGATIAPLALVLYGVVLMLVVMFSPNGIFGIIKRTQARIKKRIADKKAPAAKASAEGVKK